MLPGAIERRRAICESVGRGARPRVVHRGQIFGEQGASDHERHAGQTAGEGGGVDSREVGGEYRWWNRHGAERSEMLVCREARLAAECMECVCKRARRPSRGARWALAEAKVGDAHETAVGKRQALQLLS